MEPRSGFSFRVVTETLRLIKLQHLLFAALLLVSAVPVLLLSTWVQHMAVQREIAAVTEKHLQIARNLGNTLERYAEDASATFDLGIDNAQRGIDVFGLPALLQSMKFRHLCIVDADGKIRAIIKSPNTGASAPLATILPQLREAASAAQGKTVFTDLIFYGGRPDLFLVKDLGGGVVGIGDLASDYFRELQKKIVLGTKGHSAIVDRTGRVIAHPDENWVATAFDLSGLYPIQQMKLGETGVATFYSPAVKAQMIAGYTTVPSTGWGVMVPQPLSELIAQAGNVQMIAIAITVFGFLVAALISWWLARFLARPIATMAGVAEEIAAGDTGARVPEPARIMPKEVRKLGTSFNNMIDELSRKNEELADTADRAEAASNAKSAFLANVSHELRTPLNAIIGFSECISAEVFGPLGNRRYAAYAKDIHLSGKHLLEVINGILDLSKAEAGAVEVILGEVDPAKVSNVAMRLVEQRAQRSGVNLHGRIDPALEGTQIVTDEGKLLQILLNLLSNAVKFTRNGGTVMLDVAAPNDNSIIFVVRDTGIGIRPEDMSRVMEPFGQAVSALHAHEGTGLGLPLAKTFAESLGGSLRIESMPGIGTTAIVELPRLARAAAAE